MRSCSQFAGHQAARGGKMRAAATIDWDGFEIGSAAPDAGARGRGGTRDEARTSAHGPDTPLEVRCAIVD